MFNKICFINLFRAKTRSALTVSAIAVGVFAVTIISSAGSAGKAQISKTLETMGINSILVQNENAATSAGLTESDVIEINKIAGVRQATPLMASVNKAQILNSRVNCYTWGINAGAKEIISLEALHGRLITAQDVSMKKPVCVIDEDIAKAAYGRSNVVGKTARLLLGGAFHDFEIVGVAKSGISSLQSALSGIIPNFAYVPISTMQMLTGRNAYDKIAVLINDKNAFNSNGDNDAIIDSIKKAVLNSKEDNSGLIVSNLLRQKQGLEDIMSAITLVLSLIAGISLVVSGLTVTTTMIVSVNERTREIGIKKSIGAKDFDIAREFLLESVLLSGAGAGIGALLGFLVTAVGCAVFKIEFAPDFFPVLLAGAVAVLVGGVFGAYPAVKAARLEPIEALRL